MAQSLFDWLSQEKDKHKILGFGLDLLYYSVVGYITLFVLIKIYYFIYPKQNTETLATLNKPTKTDLKSNMKNIFSRLDSFIQPIVDFVIPPLSYIWAFITWPFSNKYRALMLIITILFFIGFYYFRKLYDYSILLKKYSSYISGFIIILGTLLTLGVFGLFSGNNGEIKIKEPPDDDFG